MFCTQCGLKNDDKNVFCIYCGARMESIVVGPAENGFANQSPDTDSGVQPNVEQCPIEAQQTVVSSQPAVVSEPVAHNGARVNDQLPALTGSPAKESDTQPAVLHPAVIEPPVEYPPLPHAAISQTSPDNITHIPHESNIGSAYRYDYQPIADYDETSVLPEYPDEGETTVQPGGISGYQRETAETTILTGGYPGAMEGESPQGQGQEAPETTILSQSGSQFESQQPAQQKYEPATSTTRIPQLSLRFTRRNGDTCVLSGYPTIVGTASDCNLVIADNPSISRHHVRILRDGNVFAAEDLGSSNKTYIGNYCLAPSTPTILTDGDDLRLGSEVLRVSIFE